MNNYILYLVINIILLVGGQLVWKIGLMEIGTFSIMALMTSVHVWVGIFLYGIATIVWLKILSIAPLSVAYPMQSFAYVLGILVAYFYLGETVPITRWIGSILIMIGVGLIAS